MTFTDEEDAMIDQYAGRIQCIEALQITCIGTPFLRFKEWLIATGLESEYNNCNDPFLITYGYGRFIKLCGG